MDKEEEERERRRRARLTVNQCVMARHYLNVVSHRARDLWTALGAAAVRMQREPGATELKPAESSVLESIDSLMAHLNGLRAYLGVETWSAPGDITSVLRFDDERD